jgi:hypothetical protein
MDRRRMLGVMGAGAGGLIAAAGREAQAQHPHHHDKVHGDCLKACTECAAVCSETFHDSLEHLKDGHKEHAHVTELTLDCQEFCTLAAELMGRESPLMGLACVACADACKACAEECQKHDQKQLKECVVACLVCEKACRAMHDHMKNHEHHTG